MPVCDTKQPAVAPRFLKNYALIDSDRPMKITPSEVLGLIEAAKRGDRESLVQLLESYRGYLRVFASKKISTKLQGRFDASDIVQHTLKSAVFGFHSFEGATVEELQAWLRQIHERNLKDAIREHLNAAKRSVDLEDGTAEEQAPEQESWVGPSRIVIFGEDAARVANALGELPDDQQTAIRLRYLDELSLQEMEERMNRSKAACAGLLKRGLARLREILGAD